MSEMEVCLDTRFEPSLFALARLLKNHPPATELDMVRQLARLSFCNLESIIEIRNELTKGNNDFVCYRGSRADFS